LGQAHYINQGVNNSTIFSAFAQGTASFVITIAMTRIVAWFFDLLPEAPITLIVPSILTICITGSGLFILHLSIQTPRIFHTISPPLTVAFIFCLFVTLKLRKSYNGQLQK
jgi:hypothetical protein